ncbi:MAG: hypothetical protein AAGB00_11340 [Planctomycetota bacterium]
MPLPRRLESRRPIARRLSPSAALAAVLLAAVAPAEGGHRCPGEGCPYLRPQDEVLIVSVRRLGCTTDTSRFRSEMRAERYLGTGASASRGWQGISIDEAIASIEPSMPTVVFVHGNRVEPIEVRPRSVWVYRKLVDRRNDPRPIRFLAFSWPSDEISGVLRDVNVKAARTKPAAFQLAWVLDQTPTGTPLGMMGYSFGARIISGATHLLAGGSLGRLALPGVEPRAHRPIRGVYVAPAFDADWLGRGRYHGRSLQQVDNLLIATNRRDPAMRYFGLINRDRHPKAMGFEGPTCLSRGDSQRVRLLNMSKAVGRTHDMCEYLMVSGLMSNAWRRLSFADRPASVAASAAAGAKGTPPR